MDALTRTTHDVQQGTGDWLRLREGFDTASEAPAALGVGKYVSRAELLRRKHTGVAEEHSPATLAKFRAGHEAEDRARPLAEMIVEGDLYPVTMSIEVAGLRLLASLDGLTLDGSIAWETKLWNEELAAHVRAGTLPEHYTVQMDQELFVSGAQRCLFTCTDGTADRFASCWYEADPAKFDALLNGWMQFHRDLAAYVLPESVEPAPAGKAPESLPALRIEVTGEVTASNLAEFKQTALTAIRSVNRDLKTDADFADAAKAVQWCADVESRLKAAKEHALSQTSSIDTLFKAIDDISTEARAVRLDLDKLVTRRKTEVKEHAVAAARKALDQHIAGLEGELAPMKLAPDAVDFAGAIKGLRSIASMQDALDTALASGKIAADAQARVIRANVATFKASAEGHGSLFPDLHVIVHKPAEDFAATLHARIAQHRIAEQARESARKRAEDERIQAEARRLADELARLAEAKRQVDDLAARTAEAARLADQQQAAAAPVAPMATQAPQPVLATPAAPPQRPAVVTHQLTTAGRDEPATLNLGAICGRLGFAVSAQFLADVLHIQPARTDKASKLYTETQFAAICRQLQSHVSAMVELYSSEVPA